MDFDKVRETCGLELAIVLCWPETDEDLDLGSLAKLSFDQWLTIEKIAAYRPEVSEYALNKLIEFGSFDRWSRTYGACGVSAHMRKTAFEQMQNLASEFGHWRTIHQILESKGEPSEHAFNMMIELANYLTGCFIALTSLDLAPQTKKQVVKRMKTLGDFEDWYDLYRFKMNDETPEDIKELAVAMMKKRAKSFVQAHRFYCLVRQPVCIERMCDFADTLYGWREIYLAAEPGSEIHKRAFTNMQELANSR